MQEIIPRDSSTFHRYDEGKCHIHVNYFSLTFSEAYATIRKIREKGYVQRGPFKGWDTVEKASTDKMKILFFTVLLILFFIALILTYPKIKHQHKEVHFSQKANSSSGAYWDYSLSTNTVISEKEHYETRFPLNFGPGYTENWIFEIMDEGNVTIQWLAYQGGFLSEKDSYCITSHFEKNGEYHVISES